MTGKPSALAHDNERIHYGMGAVLYIDHRWRTPGTRDTALIVASADELEQLHVYLPDVEHLTNP